MSLGLNSELEKWLKGETTPLQNKEEDSIPLASVTPSAPKQEDFSLPVVSLYSRIPKTENINQTQEAASQYEQPTTKPLQQLTQQEWLESIIKSQHQEMQFPPIAKPETPPAAEPEFSSENKTQPDETEKIDIQGQKHISDKQANSDIGEITSATDTRVIEEPQTFEYEQIQTTPNATPQIKYDPEFDSQTEVEHAYKQNRRRQQSMDLAEQFRRSRELARQRDRRLKLIICSIVVVLVAAATALAYWLFWDDNENDNPDLRSIAIISADSTVSRDGEVLSAAPEKEIVHPSLQETKLEDIKSADIVSVDVKPAEVQIAEGKSPTTEHTKIELAETEVISNDTKTLSAEIEAISTDTKALSVETKTTSTDTKTLSVKPEAISTDTAVISAKMEATNIKLTEKKSVEEKSVASVAKNDAVVSVSEKKQIKSPADNKLVSQQKKKTTTPSVKKGLAQSQAQRTSPVKISYVNTMMNKTLNSSIHTTEKNAELKSLVRNERNTDAIALSYNMLKADNKNREVFFLLGVALYNISDYNAAKNAFEKCLSLGEAPLPEITVDGVSSTAFGTREFSSFVQIPRRMRGDMRTLSRAVALNKGDRALYVNLISANRKSNKPELESELYSRILEHATRVVNLP